MLVAGFCSRSSGQRIQARRRDMPACRRGVAPCHWMSCGSGHVRESDFSKAMDTGYCLTNHAERLLPVLRVFSLSASMMSRSSASRSKEKAAQCLRRDRDRSQERSIRYPGDSGSHPRATIRSFRRPVMCNSPSLRKPRSPVRRKGPAPGLSVRRARKVASVCSGRRQ